MVVQNRVWHMAAFTGRNLINHSHYLSIPCTWAQSPSAQNQPSVAYTAQEHQRWPWEADGKGALHSCSILLGHGDHADLTAPYHIPPSSLMDFRRQYLYMYPEYCHLGILDTNRQPGEGRGAHSESVPWVPANRKWIERGYKANNVQYY